MARKHSCFVLSILPIYAGVMQHACAEETIYLVYVKSLGDLVGSPRTLRACSSKAAIILLAIFSDIAALTAA